MTHNEFVNNLLFTPNFASQFYGKNKDERRSLINSYLSAGTDAALMHSVLDTSRQEYLDDRAHTEMREDTAYQRGVADMKAAGLNPYTIGANPASSSASNVGENSIQSKLQILGYILDLKNLDIKNRQVTNQAIGNVLKMLKVY